MKLIRPASLATLILTVLVACAKVGDPLPPLPKGPLKAETSRLIQSGDELLFLFTEPLGALDRAELYRRCGTSSEPERTLAIPMSELSVYPETNEKFLISKLSNKDKECHFSVKLVDAENHESEFSPWLRARKIPSPPSPFDLSSKVEQDRIVITWKMPDPLPRNVLGYLVNSRFTVTSKEFIDRNFEFGVPVEYWVQTVIRHSSPMVLSPKSALLSITPQDTFPPGAPQNLRAIPLENSVQLIWDAETSSDLAGYRLFRGTEPNQLSVIAELVEVNRFLDDSLPVGTMFYYEMTVLDKSGNESKRSETVSVTLNR